MLMFRDRKSDGFTLVELLVVISIIALLLSILMPSLQKARESAKKVVCGSNLKQQALAHSLYSADNDEKYIHLFIKGYPGWTRDISLLIGGHQVWTPGATYRPKQKVLNAYVDNNYNVFKCPGDKGMKGPLSTGKLTVFEANGNSYAYNGYGNDPMNDYYGDFDTGQKEPKKRAYAGRKTSGTKRLSDIIFHGELVMHMFHNGLEEGEREYAWHSRKGINMANLVFGDGHYAYTQMTYDKIKDPQSFQEGKGFDFTMN